jgi:hypothetical protein
VNENYQTFFNISVTLIGFLGGWVLNSLKSSIDALHKADADLTAKVQSVEVLVAGQYVKRDDLNELSKAIFNKLDRIEAKLDSKVDKP